MPAVQLKECRTADEVLSNYKAVRERMRALKPPQPKIRIIPIQDRTPSVCVVKIRFTARRIPKVADIVTHVGKHYGFSYIEMVSERRQGPLVRARLMAYYLCKELTPHSYPRIANMIGGRDHSTVLSGVQRLLRRMRDDPDIAMEVHELQQDARRVLA